MKTLVTSYTFDASEKQITFTGTAPQDISSVLLITNVTDGIIIYNFADPTTGGTLAGSVLTLKYNTTAMSDTDSLQIFIDVPNSNYEDLTEILRTGLVEIVRQLQSIRNDGGMADVAGRVRVAIETGSVGIISNQTIGTVTTLSNVGSMGGFALQSPYMAVTNGGAQRLRNYIVVS